MDIPSILIVNVQSTDFRIILNILKLSVETRETGRQQENTRKKMLLSAPSIEQKGSFSFFQFDLEYLPLFAVCIIYFYSLAFFSGVISLFFNVYRIQNYSEIG